MKRSKKFKFPIKTRFFLLIMGLVTIILTPTWAQDDDEPVKRAVRPVENTFESIWLIDNQTVMVPYKGTLEFDIQHRFGIIDNGFDDMWGLYAPSNIRIGFNYVPLEKLQLGFGFVKERKTWDFHAKYAIFRQGRDGGSPLSVTYLVNAAADSRDGDFHEEYLDRWSFFHQLMAARKISDRFSLQASFSLSYFNYQAQSFASDGELLAQDQADHYALAFLTRYVLKEGTNFIAGVDLPMTEHGVNDAEPNYSFGLEFVTSSHAFQVFVGNYYSIVPQYNNLRNSNKFGDNEILIGFNMTRLWNF